MLWYKKSVWRKCGRSSGYLELVSVLVVLQLLDEGRCRPHGCHGNISIVAAQALLQDAVEGAHVLGERGHDVVRQLGEDEQG